MENDTAVDKTAETQVGFKLTNHLFHVTITPYTSKIRGIPPFLRLDLYE